MSISAFTTGETLEQIVNDCERITANPGLDRDPATKLPPADGFLDNAPAYRWLRDIIRNLYLVHDWPFAIQARTLIPAPGTERCLLLPDDFWRVAYDNPLYGLITGQERFKISQLTRPQFFDKVDLARGRIGRPESFYVDRMQGLIYLNPIQDLSYTYELHYFSLPEAGTSITSITLFPYKDYLRSALLVMYYKDQDDDRLADEEKLREQLWMQIRGTNYDLREEPTNPPLGILDSQWFLRVCYED